MAMHHEVTDRDPLPIRSLASHAAAKLRDIAIAAIARDEGCSLEEAAQRLDGTPTIDDAETPEQVAERRRQAECKRIEARLRELAMPVRGEMLPAIAAGKVRPTEATRHVSRWLASPHRVLVLVGDMGVGKTIASALGVAAWVRRRKTVAYLREPALVRWWHSTTLAHEQRVEALRSADMLVIDELGTSATRDAEKARDAIFGMLDDRIGLERRTMLIGNLTPDDLTVRYGARFGDRLAEVATVAHVVGPSMRGQR